MITYNMHFSGFEKLGAQFHEESDSKHGCFELYVMVQSVVFIIFNLFINFQAILIILFHNCINFIHFI